MGLGRELIGRSTGKSLNVSVAILVLSEARKQSGSVSEIKESKPYRRGSVVLYSASSLRYKHPSPLRLATACRP